MSCHKAQEIAKVCFSTLQSIREEASFHMFFQKVRSSARKLEIDDPRLPRKRKVSSHYEEGEAPVEFVSTVEEHKFYIKQLICFFNCIRDRFQQNHYIETLQTMERRLVKVLREEDLSHKLQQISSFYSSDLNKLKLETQLKTLTHLVDEK